MFLKKLLAGLFNPLPLGLGIVAAGVILLWFTGRQRAGRLCVTIGFAFLVLFGLRGVTDRFVIALEDDFHPLLVEGVPPDSLDEKARNARWIVVLGGGHSIDRHLPPNSELNDLTLARLIEALRLKHRLPAAKLVLSGGFGDGNLTHADLLAGAAVALGCPREDLVLEKRTFDTADEARLISPIVGQDPFILVSSASHLPRAVRLFRKQGKDPLPSPTDYAAIPSPLGLDSFLPSPNSLLKLERAQHEYLGRLWSSLRGQL
jgi:uncharacterized SAM-binding protein YcdF (DUF218 family)